MYTPTLCSVVRVCGVRHPRPFTFYWFDLTFEWGESKKCIAITDPRRVGGRDRCGARFHPGPDRRRPTRPGGRREAPGPRAPACPGVPGRGRERRELSELTDSMSSLVTQWVRRPAGVFTRRIGRAVLTKFMSHDGRSPSIKSDSPLLAAWRGATRSTSSQSSLSSAMDALHASRHVGCFASI